MRSADTETDVSSESARTGRSRVPSRRGGARIRDAGGADGRTAPGGVRLASGIAGIVLAGAACAGAPKEVACRFPDAEATPLAASLGDDGALELSDGRRLVPEGIALPTSLADPAQRRAAQAAAEAVLDGRTLAIGPDRTDRHGRLAAAAALAQTGAAEDLAVALLRAGAGLARPVPGDAACGAGRLAAEAEARQARRGLWALDDALLAAGDEDALAVRGGLFTVAEGRVREVGMAGGRVFLNFGTRWRQDFTVIIAMEDFATILGDSLDPAALSGRLVRVRGVVREDGGPAMTLRLPGELVLVSEPGRAR